MDSLHQNSGRINGTIRLNFLVTVKLVAAILLGLFSVFAHAGDCEFDDPDTVNTDWVYVNGKYQAIFYKGDNNSQDSGTGPYLFGSLRVIPLPNFDSTNCNVTGAISFGLFDANDNQVTDVDQDGYLSLLKTSTLDTGVEVTTPMANQEYITYNPSSPAWGAAPVEYTLKADAAFSDTLDEFTFTVTVLPQLLSQPSEIGAYAESNESIYVNWVGDGTGDATHYEVAWSATGGASGNKVLREVVATGNRQQYNIINLAPNTTYSVSIRSLKPGSASNLYDDQYSKFANSTSSSTDRTTKAPKDDDKALITRTNPIRLANGTTQTFNAIDWIYPNKSQHLDGTTFTYSARSGNSTALEVEFFDDGDSVDTDHLIRLKGLAVANTTYGKIEARGSDGSTAVATVWVKVLENATKFFSLTSMSVLWDVEVTTPPFSITVNTDSVVSSGVDTTDLSWSMTGGAHGGVTYLQINSTTGKITVPSGTNLTPLETGVEFELTVTAEDSKGFTDSLTIYVDVVEGDDKPYRKTAADIWLAPIAESNGGGSESIDLENYFEDPEGDKLCYEISSDTSNKGTAKSPIEVADVELAGSQSCKTSYLTITMNLPSTNPTDPDYALLGRVGVDEVEAKVVTYQQGDKINKSKPVTVKIKLVFGASNVAPAVRKIAKVTGSTTFVSTSAHSVKENTAIRLTFTADDASADPSGPAVDDVCWSDRGQCKPCIGPNDSRRSSKTTGNVSYEYNLVVPSTKTDYESNRDGYTIQLCATDLAGKSETLNFVVTILDVPEAPKFKTIDDLYFVVGDYGQTIDLEDYVTDGDGIRDIVSYEAEIVGSSTAITLSLDDSELTVTPTDNDLSKKALVDIEVAATDTTGRKAYGYFTAHVKNSNLSPYFTNGVSSISFKVNENAARNTKVGILLTATDPDAGDVVVYEVSGSNYFSIDSSRSGGQLKVARSGIDYEKGPKTHRLVVTASDGYGGASTMRVNIDVQDVNEPPVATDAIIPHQRILLGMEDCLVKASDHFSDPDEADKTAGLLIEVSSTRPGDAYPTVVNNDDICVEGKNVGTGPARITIKASDREGNSAVKRFRVSVEQNNPPKTASTGGLPDMEVQLDGKTDDIDLDLYFDDGDPTYDETLTYTASNDASDIATSAIVREHYLRIYGNEDGTANVTITATDQNDQSHAQTFQVTITRNDPPVADTTAIDDVLTRVDKTVDPIDTSDAFEDEGDSFTLTVATNDPEVATTSLVYDDDDVAWIRVYVHGVGTTVATLTAVDTAQNTASVTFDIEVLEKNDPPTVASPIDDIAVEIDARYDIDLDGVFADERDLDISIEIEDDNVCDVVYRKSTNILRVYGYIAGDSFVDVTATDDIGQTVTDRFNVLVARGKAPVVAAVPVTQRVGKNGTREIVLDGVFTDPDGDDLTFTASSDDTSILTTTISGQTLTLRGISEGDAQATVKATDTYGLYATVTFDVVVGVQDDPPKLIIPFSDVTVEQEKHANITLDGVFEDDGTLDYEVSVGDDSIAYAVYRSSTNSIRIYGSAIGTTEVTVTATDDVGQTISDTFTVTVIEPNDPPRVVKEIADQIVETEAQIDVDIEGVFEDEGELDYEATSSDSALADAFYRRSSNSVRVYGLAVGTVTITVTATDDKDQSAETTFEVEVIPSNDPPELAKDLEDQTVTAGEDATYSIDGYFTDPDGDRLSYAISSSNDSIATLRLNGTTIEITGLRYGTATASVTASDPDGLSVTGTFKIFVETAPEFVKEFEDQTVTVGTPLELSVHDHFADDDGDRLSYSATSSNQDAATVEMDGDDLTITGVKPGETTITVTASDPKKRSASGSFEVKVETAPMLVKEFDDQTVTVGEPLTLGVADHFIDEDGDPLTFKAMSSDEDKATVIMDGSNLIITGHNPGDTTITVTASDPKERSASGSFDATIETAPHAVGSMPDVELQIGGDSVATDLSEYFDDRDGDALTYTIAITPNTDNPGDIDSTITNENLTITAKRRGTLTATVTASDPKARTATQEFTVTVSDSELRNVASSALAGFGRSVIGSVGNTIGSRMEGNRGDTQAPAFVPATRQPDREIIQPRTPPQTVSANSGVVNNTTTPKTTQATTSTRQDTPPPTSNVSWGVIPAKSKSQDKNKTQNYNFSSLVGNQFSKFLGSGHGNQGQWSIWGSMDFQAYEGEGYDGGSSGFFLGADVEALPGFLLGAAVSHHSGESDYSWGTAEQTLETNVTSVLPYVSFKPGRNSVVWGVVGRGSGEATTTVVNGNAASSDLTMNVGMFGGNTQFASIGPMSFAVRGDLAFVNLTTDDEGTGPVDNMEVSVNRMRIGLRTTMTNHGEGFSFMPYGEMNFRNDGGDGATGSGLEIAGGVKMHTDMFSVEARGFTVAAHAAEDFSESGVSLIATFSSSPGPTGFTFSVAPSWGSTTQPQSLVWVDSAMGSVTGGNSLGVANGNSLNANLAYSMYIDRDRYMLTPYLQYVKDEYNNQSMLLGTSLKQLIMSSALVDMELRFGRTKTEFDEAGNQLEVNARLLF